MKPPGNICRELFSFDRPETRGDYLRVKLVEAVMGVLTLLFVWKWAAYVTLLDQINHPLGLAVWLDLSFLLNPWIARLNALLVTVLVLVAYSGRGRWYMLAIVLFHLQYVARFSQGAVGHGSNMAGMIMLCFGLASLFFKDPAMLRKTSFGLTLFFVGLGYLSAGLTKLVGTGIGWPDGVHLHLWISERSVDLLSQKGSFELNALQIVLLDSRVFSTLLLAFGLLVELSGFLLWFGRTRFIQTLLLIAMHVGISLTMNIFFKEYILVLMAVGFPWNHWLDRWLDRNPKSILHSLLRSAGD